MSSARVFFLLKSRINFESVASFRSISLRSFSRNRRACVFMRQLQYTGCNPLSIAKSCRGITAVGGVWSMEDSLLSVSEAARKLGGISKWTVHAWLSQGKLQRTKVGGRTMIRESELSKVIQDGPKSGVASK